jgi:RNA polymerase sigma factor (sigma-70 family)
MGETGVCLTEPFDMATSTGRSVIRHLSRAAVLSDDVARPDAELLADFIARREESAFTALVRRHGPMVLAVCRRVVGNPHDADDAFQAAFLVLARKSASIVDRGLLANWLYGVAYRTALEARTRMLRRSAAETTLPNFPDPAGEPADDNAELLALLDRELNRLADKYRVPVVLCELEGRSRREAAELLGIPEGTLSSRLAAARRMLADRLLRRGVAVSVGAVTAALSHRAASASVPASLIARAVTAATSDSGAPTVVALSQGVLKAMLLKKLQMTAALSLLGIGTVVLTFGLGAGRPAAAQPDDKPKPSPVEKPPETKPGKGSLLGGWKIIKATANGREESADHGPTALFFGADKGYMMGKDDLFAAFTYKVDGTAKPNHIDLVLDGEAVVGKTHKLIGLIELSGEFMKLALSEGADARPEAFESKEGSRTIVLVLQRDKDVKEPDPKNAGKVEEAKSRMVSSNNLKQMGLAMHNYLSTYNKFPTGAIYSKDGKPLLSWRVSILPYIEQDALYKEFHLDEPWDSEHNKKLLAQMPKIYGAKGTQTHYRVFTGKDTMFPAQKGLGPADITDGFSNTILIVEAPEAVDWTKPEELEYDAEKPLPKLGGKPRANGTLVCIADGSVRMLPTTIPEKTLRALITPAGGEKIEPEEKKKEE